ncbi:unnamed protein product [[Candida] boidinii]|uniref:Unnamed protein product n=1 Tax=Candida boidinii TaxID=5477 RepID=A0A9W6SUV9_CANBO|nr:hypothetical protein B5S30_g672 [[Candida] boidinii]GME67159.1 unnamed protein product [[Candida] boidinii]GMG03143.1 unnamed protein product [[Candida] boidinii]
MVYTSTSNGIAQLVFYIIFTGFVVYDFIVYLTIRSRFPRFHNLYLLGVLGSIAFVCFWRIINSAVTISFQNNDASDSKVAAIICFEYFGLAFYLLAFLFITLFLLPTQLANKAYLIPTYVSIGFLSIGFILNIAAAGTYNSDSTTTNTYWFYSYDYNSHSVHLYEATAAFYFITFFAIVAQAVIDFIFANSSVVVNSPTLLALIIFPTLFFLLLRSIFGLLTASDHNVFLTSWSVLGSRSHFGGMELFPEIMIFIGLQTFLFFVAYDSYAEKAGLTKIVKGRTPGDATTTATAAEGGAAATTTTDTGADVLTDGDTYIGDINSKDIENSPGEFTEKPVTTDYSGGLADRPVTTDYTGGYVERPVTTEFSGDLADEQIAPDAIDMAKPQN